MVIEMYPEYADMLPTEIDFETRRTILTTLFAHLLVKIEELPVEVKEVVIAKMLEGNS